VITDEHDVSVWKFERSHAIHCFRDRISIVHHVAISADDGVTKTWRQCQFITCRSEWSISWVMMSIMMSATVGSECRPSHQCLEGTAA
jgi:hypothetical protein